ncbi:MAG: sensor histidine kinase [Phycisphaerales bacterium JB039]
MRRTLFRALGSLEARLLIPLCLTIGVVLAAHAVLGFRATTDHFARLVHSELERCSQMVIGATHDAMLLNRPQEVQATIERLVNAPEMSAIRVYDKGGMITRSTHQAELGTQMALQDAACASCHPGGLETGPAVVQHGILARSLDGHDVLRRLTVIENQPACTEAACHIHPAEQEILGVLDIEMSMAPYDLAIAAARRHLLWTTLLLLAISAFVSFFFVRRVVQRPVADLHKGTLRIAAGDLDTRIDVRGADELARLGEAFNTMVADLRQARQDVTRWSETLEQRVQAKTEELQHAQRQVLHMETMASLGKLSATVAHELNNPISGILTYARLVKRELAEQPIDESIRAQLERYLTLVDKECTRCGAIVHNLLTFARRKGSAMAPVDLNEIVNRSVMLIDHHLHIHGVRCLVHHLEGDPIVVADGGQIEQALLALLMNAVEAMQAAGKPEPTLTVRLSADDDRVTLEVSDTGVGIAPETLEQIFEPFFSTKGNESGVGLGLAVVYGIVNRHEGSIAVDSEPGVGTTVRIQLPRRPAAADAPGAGRGSPMEVR